MKQFFCLVITLSFYLSAISKETLVITGSSTIAPVISDLAKDYERANKNIRIDVQTGGSSRGILDTRKGLSQIGMVSRQLKASENDLLRYTFARDGLAVIVHKSNKVEKLSDDQIRGIYLGKIDNWKQVGGIDKKIVVINKAEGRSTLELFTHFFRIKNSQIEADIVIGDNEQGIKSVVNNPNSIAYVSIGTAEYNQKAGLPLKLLKLRGVEAKVENVASNKYPLTRELNLVVKAKPSRHIDSFIKFVMSKNANHAVKDHYFVPINTK